MVYLGQYRNCFLLGQVDDRLIVIDQHAAHERVMFERIREQFEKGPVVSQRLLVPMLLELDLRLVAVLEERRELLERLGFVVEPFGSGSVAVKAVPLLLKQRNPELPLMAVLSDLADAGGLAGPELFHKTLATMACHSAVRAGDPMERAEVLALLRQMDQVDLAAYCPHGRPVVAMFDESEVARWFKRT
jgi:DNA mismatch repair protein MutL